MPSPTPQTPLVTGVSAPGSPFEPRHSALDLIDESIHLLRTAPSATLAAYYGATLPFVLALLYFWADQRRNPDAESHATAAALGITLLFIGMKIGHAVFAAGVFAQIRRQGRVAWTAARLARLASVQLILQPSGLFLLTIAAIITVPLGWAYAFYQNVTALGGGETGSAREVLQRAARAALHRPGQNHAALSMLSLMAFFLWLNIIAAVVGAPYLLRTFTGTENLFTRSGWGLFNSTFFAITVALVYLALDPVAKTFYALRCFYEEARRTGEDLRGDLAPAASLPAASTARAALAAVLLAALLLPASALAADPSPAPVPPARTASSTVSPPALGRSIDEVLRQREFSWRNPRPKEGPAAYQEGPLDSFFRGVKSAIKSGLKTVGGWIEKLIRWWNPRPRRRSPSGGGGFDFAGLVPALVVGLIILVVGIALWLVYEAWRGRRRAAAITGQAVTGAAAVPDLTDDTLLATQLPEDEWRQIGLDLLARGDRRLALRAFYLSILSGLGARGLLAIARHKSNRDYVRELRRRARDRSEMQGAFARAVSGFERVWYGEHPADDSLLADFQTDRQRVLADSPI